MNATGYFISRQQVFPYVMPRRSWYEKSLSIVGNIKKGITIEFDEKKPIPFLDEIGISKSEWEIFTIDDYIECAYRQIAIYEIYHNLKKEIYFPTHLVELRLLAHEYTRKNDIKNASKTKETLLAENQKYYKWNEKIQARVNELKADKNPPVAIKPSV